MAAITQTIIITDFIPKDYTFRQNDSGAWGIYVRGDEVDALGNIINADVVQGLPMPPARLATWQAFAALILTAVKVRRGLDNGL